MNEAMTHDELCESELTSHGYSPCRCSGDAPNDRDKAFIAHARTDVPALVAEVERLRGALQRIVSYPDAEMFTSLAPAHDMRETARGALVTEEERLRLLREGEWDIKKLMK